MYPSIIIFFFPMMSRSCYCISYKVHLLFMVIGLKIKKCAKTLRDQSHPLHVFLGLQCYIFTHFISTGGNALLKVGIYFERIAMVTKGGPKFCIQHSKIIFFQQERCTVIFLLKYHRVLWFKHFKKMRVGTSKGVKLWRACIPNYSLAYSHAATTELCHKGDFLSLFSTFRQKISFVKWGNLL